jgi:hypothetical protein
LQIGSEIIKKVRQKNKNTDSIYFKSFNLTGNSSIPMPIQNLAPQGFFVIDCFY